jgi:ATP-dependent DNA helicase RecQ
VVRTGRRFGLSHIVDVLRGRMTDKVAQFGHDRLPTFGIGSDLPDRAWKGVARQLVARGALDVAIENHGELLPTEAARPILKGEEPLMLREESLPARPAARAATPAAGPLPADEALFDALRAWRKQEAQDQGVPAYVIFHDRSLVEIAARRPSSLDALAAVPGVGQSKLDRYGAAVLAVVAGHGG